MANIRRMTKKRLGELLLHEGLISEEQLEGGLEEQKQTGELIGEILVRKGHVNESDVARTISTQFSFPYLAVSHYYIAPEMRDLFTLERLEKNCFVPIDRFGDVLAIVIAGLLDQDVIDEIEKETSSSIQVYVGKVSEVKQTIKEKFAGDAPATAPGKGSKAAAASAVDITAPPDIKPVAKKKKSGEEEDQEIADAVDAPRFDVEKPEPSDKGDDEVVKELESQFKKFRFAEGDAGKDRGKKEG